MNGNYEFKLFPFLSLFSGKRMIHLRIKFDVKKKVVLPVFSFEKNMFRIILPVKNNNGDIIDIIDIKLPMQVVANPDIKLYRYLRMRGVI